MYLIALLGRNVCVYGLNEIDIEKVMAFLQMKSKLILLGKHRSKILDEIHLRT